MPAIVGIALGSNLGSSLDLLRTSRDMLLAIAPQSSNHLQAPIYRSKPLNCPEGSPDFLNTVIEITYSGSARELLKQTQAIEAHLGREARYIKNAPRTIDIDILYFGAECIDDEHLVIPHPEIIHRRFVLEPLAAIRPELILPGDHHSVTEHLHQLDSAEQPLILEQSDW